LRSRSPSQRKESVSQDWRSPLSDNKTEAYARTLYNLETAFGMFSVNLDEALGMRRDGRLTKAYQILTVAPALCLRVTQPLAGVLRAMLLHARHFGTSPNLTALDAANFQNPRSQRVARLNGLFTRVLLTRRSQFTHKISALMELVEDLGRVYAASIEEMELGTVLRPDRNWEILDETHYDLNTCLRETVVLLKCFFQALPDEQLHGFLDTLQHQAVWSGTHVTVPVRHLAHRRLAAIKGQ
jgi:hypothetical protein